jgi:hypothetical protein
MLRFAHALLWPLYVAGAWAAGVRARLEAKWLLAEALQPETKVHPTCPCHFQSVWYVERFDLDANDYRIVSTWPPPDQFGRRLGVDVMYLKRKQLQVIP